MRVIIRHQGSGFYYAGERRWVGDPWAAQEFDNAELAGHAVQQHHLSGTSVVLRYDAPICELALPPELAAQHAERLMQ